MNKKCQMCEHYVPAWEGDKNNAPQPAWCLKNGVALVGEILGCDKFQKRGIKNDMQATK